MGMMSLLKETAIVNSPVDKNLGQDSQDSS
jgi:hypothetical protein